MQPFILSIEPRDGRTRVHGFHLGTDVNVARTIAKEYFHANYDNLVTVALMRDGKMFDVYDGQWLSDYFFTYE